jgi:hypothetical protein
MATLREIRCINKSDRYNAHERIINIGGLNYDQTTWKISVSEAIKGIKNGTWEFYVNRAGLRVNVIIAKTSEGNEYLKTQSDSIETNNLLELPECK